MTESQAVNDGRGVAATYDDLIHIVGDIDQREALQILALRPTIREVEEAAAWATGNGDLLAKAGTPLTGIAAEIYEILTSEEEEPPPTR